MNVDKNRHITRHSIRHHRQRQKSKQAETHWVDVWLPRISHFSQFGLFVITIGGFYFTVLPLYQKAVLEEVIAQKEVQLVASEKALNRSYIRLRGFAIKEFIFSTSAKCSGLLISPKTLQSLHKKPSSSPSIAEEIFNIKIEKCIREDFEKSKSLKELNSADLQVLASNVNRIIADIALKKEHALTEYQSIPRRAKADPSILKPLGLFSEQILAVLSKSQPAAWVEANRFSLAVKATQSAVVHEYETYIRDQIMTLRSIKWEAPR